MFVELVDWVVDRGGYVHKAVGWDDTTRTLTTRQTIAPNTVVLRIPAVFPKSEYSFPWPPPHTIPAANDNNTCIDNRTTTAPVTNSSSSSNNINDNEDEDDDDVVRCTKSRRENDKNKLHHSVQDLQLAWMLAQQPTTLQPYLNSLPAQIDLPRHHYHHNGAVSSSGGGGTTIPKQPQAVNQRETDACGGGGVGDNVLWMLTGSSVESHIQKSSVGVVNDYNSIIGSSATTAAPPKITTNSPTSTDTTITSHSSSPPSSSSSTNPPRLPTFDEFSHAMAVVSSRAFSYTESSELANSGDDANVGNAPRTSSVLVPILDLCNHCRGLDSRSKNLAYTFESSMLPKDSTEREDTVAVMVVVTTTATVTTGDTFRVTYGAIGNAVLLLNYGFCIPNNIEPDGSSNDMLEFYPHKGDLPLTPAGDPNVQDPTSRVILLRTGPKAYTYSCFMTAIHSFYPVLVVTSEDDDDDNHGMTNGIVHDYMDDLHVTDFDDDENGNDDDGESVDLYTTGMTNDDANDDIHNNGFGPSTHIGRIKEITALEKLLERLQQVANGYYSVSTDTNTINSIGSRTTPPTLLEMSAAILIQSELRTLDFFVQAVDRVLHRLSLMDNASPQKRSKPTITETTSLINATESDKALLDTQIDELVQTYMQIRHYRVTDAD